MIETPLEIPRPGEGYNMKEEKAEVTTERGMKREKRKSWPSRVVWKGQKKRKAKRF